MGGCEPLAACRFSPAFTKDGVSRGQDGRRPGVGRVGRRFLLRVPPAHVEVAGGRLLEQPRPQFPPPPMSVESDQEEKVSQRADEATPTGLT